MLEEGGARSTWEVLGTAREGDDDATLDVCRALRGAEEWEWEEEEEEDGDEEGEGADEEGDDEPLWM